MRPGGKDVEFFQVDTNSPIPGDSVQLWSNLNIRFNGKESTYYLKVDEDINDENSHMSIKQMAAHLAAVYCEHLNKSIQDEDGRQIGAQLTKMILKL